MAFKKQTHCKNGHELTDDNTRWSLKEKGERRRICRLCNNEYHRLRAETQREDGSMRTYWRWRKIWQKYGWTPDDWQQKFDEQDGRCAGCDVPFSEKVVPCVDHDHEILVNRGLLCHWCNRGAGLLKHNIQTLQRLQAYLAFYARGAGAAMPPRNMNALSSQPYEAVSQENLSLDSRTTSSP